MSTLTLPLTLTTDPADCYSSPVRVPVGAALCAAVPDGEGMVADRWQGAAQEILTQLQRLYPEGRSGALEYRRISSGLIQLRIIDDAMPASVMLTHPLLARYLRRTAEHYFGGSAAYYVNPRGGELWASPREEAQVRQGMIGPFDLATGFCVEIDPASP